MKLKAKLFGRAFLLVMITGASSHTGQISRGRRERRRASQQLDQPAQTSAATRRTTNNERRRPHGAVPGVHVPTTPSPQHAAQIVRDMSSKGESITEFALTPDGCRVVQEALQADEGVQCLIWGAVKHHLKRFIDSQHGNFVVQAIVKFAPQFIGELVQGMTAQTIISMSKSQTGCRVVERLLENGADALLHWIGGVVMENFHHLCYSQYGHFVVEHVMEYCVFLRADLVTMCLHDAQQMITHHSASHTLEKLLELMPEHAEVVASAIHATWDGKAYTISDPYAGRSTKYVLKHMNDAQRQNAQQSLWLGALNSNAADHPRPTPAKWADITDGKDGCSTSATSDDDCDKRSDDGSLHAVESHLLQPTVAPMPELPPMFSHMTSALQSYSYPPAPTFDARTIELADATHQPYPGAGYISWSPLDQVQWEQALHFAAVAHALDQQTAQLALVPAQGPQLPTPCFDPRSKFYVGPPFDFGPDMEKFFDGAL